MQPVEVSNTITEDHGANHSVRLNSAFSKRLPPQLSDYDVDLNQDLFGSARIDSAWTRLMISTCSGLRRADVLSIEDGFSRFAGSP